MKKPGFTLIEVLAAVLLIGGAIVPMARALTQSLVISVKEERLTRVIFFAEIKLEELKNNILYDFNTDRDDADDFSYLEPDPDSDYSKYKYTVDDVLIEDEDSKLKKIEVQVWYDEGDEESITLNTEIAER